MGITLKEVHGTDINNIIAVGWDGHIQKYDGESWDIMTSGADLTDLCDVRGTGESDIYAVGKSGRILHFNGNEWESQKSGVVSTLNSIWAFDSGEVYAAGDSGILLKKNGDNWERIPLEVSEQCDLKSIWASSEQNIFVAGTSGVIVHFDGNKWSLMDVPNVEYDFYTQDFCSIWGSSADNVYATGINRFYLGHGIYYTFSPKHFNGVEWEDWPTEYDNGGTIVDIAPGLTLPSLFWGTSETNLYMASTHQGLFQFNGSIWSEVKEVESIYICDIWGPSSDDIFAIDRIGGIWHYNGSTWEGMEANIQNGFYSIWGTSPKSVYVAGPLNTILHYTENQPDDGNNHSGGGCFIQSMCP
jgi:hypothetical protein